MGRLRLALVEGRQMIMVFAPKEVRAARSNAGEKYAKN